MSACVARPLHLPLISRTYRPVWVECLYSESPNNWAPPHHSRFIFHNRLDAASATHIHAEACDLRSHVLPYESNTPNHQKKTKTEHGRTTSANKPTNLLLAPSPVPIVLSEAVLEQIVHRRAPTLVDCLLDVHLPAEVALRPLVLVRDDGRRHGRAGRSLGAHLQGNNTNVARGSTSTHRAISLGVSAVVEPAIDGGRGVTPNHNDTPLACRCA